MTLKEKFKEIIQQTKPHWHKVDSESCEKIADEFAIGFADWLDINFKLNFTNNIFKELLKIYKEEKGL